MGNRFRPVLPRSRRTLAQILTSVSLQVCMVKIVFARFQNQPSTILETITMATTTAMTSLWCDRFGKTTVFDPVLAAQHFEHLGHSDVVCHHFTLPAQQLTALVVENHFDSWL